MRFRASLALGLCGLALAAGAAILAVPATAMAAPPGDDQAVSAPAGTQTQPPHHHKGLFGWRHCVECQRAYIKAHDGVDVPPPPMFPIGAQGQVISSRAGNCPTCPGGPVMMGQVANSDPNAPGYAVVGGEGPGYAVVGEVAPGDAPAPIGVATSRQPGWGDPRTAGMGPRTGSGPFDPSVVPSSLPPAQVALPNPGRDRPHVISHLFGIPRFGEHWRAYEDKMRERHASIAYGQPDRPVTELPASVVYSTK
jgi:hypothetical protein